MTGVVNDAKTLKEFTVQLRTFNQQLEVSTKRLEHEFAKLGEVWRDQNYTRFASEFKEAMRGIHHFNEISKQFEPRLYRKIELLEELENSK